MEIIKFFTVAAFWGGSFLFMRVASPEFGPFPLAFLRVFIGFACILPIFFLEKNRHLLKEKILPIFTVGIFNMALPFGLFCIAAQYIPAGLSSLFNATTPIWTMIIAIGILRDPVTAQKIAGMILGAVGVSLLVLHGITFESPIDSNYALAVVCCLGATLSYGIAANYIKRKLFDTPRMVLTGGSLFFASLTLLIPAVWLWPQEIPSASAWVSISLLGIISTGAAYVLYFDLINRIGASATASVTFVIPAFATAFGWIFLNERLPTISILYGAIAVSGALLCTSPPLNQMLLRKRSI